MKKIIATLFLLFGILTLKAQSLVDGFMQGKGHGNVVLSYTYTDYQRFWLGDQLMDAVPVHDEISQNIVSLYANYGICDKLDVLLNVPYIAAKGHGAPDPFTGNTKESGLQDLSLFVKGKVWRAGGLSLLASLGFSTPLSNYEDNSILSIGNQGTTLNGIVLAQYQWSNGLFINGQGGYSIRYHDVPNATLWGAKVGYAGKGFYADAFLSAQVSASDSPDIMPPAVPFNETRVNYTTLGASFYYQALDHAGVSLGFGNYISGRNVGKATYGSLGVVYKF